MKKNLFISFSGGETSAYMTHLLLTKYRKLYNDVVILFANTGEENEETLIFIDRCEKRLFAPYKVVWLESVVHHSEKKSSTYRVSTFKTASRSGEPYEEVIKKYGIPSIKFPHCTRELKILPMRSYIKDLGWRDNYDTAIGIRADEPKRRSKNAAANNIVYPLLDWAPTTKPQINTWWSSQPFRLELTGYQGNCKWCWKKSTRKLLTIMNESPEHFDFPARMEKKYGLVSPNSQFYKDTNTRRTFFIGGKSVKDLRKLHKKGDYETAEDNSLDFEDGSGCSEHCEID